MMEMVFADPTAVDAIIVRWTSRFMRNVEKARVYKSRLRSLGISVIACDQETNDDPSGRLMEGIYELLDEYESEVNGVRTRAGMQKNAKRGFFNGSRAPFGKAKAKVEVEPGVFKQRLVTDESEAHTYRVLFDTYVETPGSKTTAARLNEMGLLRRGKRWTKDDVLRALADEVAIGTCYWGRTNNDGLLLEKKDWIAVPVEPIVSKDVFGLAQQLRAQREPGPSKGRTPSSPLLLAGRVRCGKCGAAYTLQTGKGGKFRYYQCRTYSRVGKSACVGYAIPNHELEAAVLDHLAEHLFTEEQCAKLVDAAAQESSSSSSRLAGERKAWRRDLTDIDKKIVRWTEAFESGDDVATLGVGRLRELREHKAALEAKLASETPAQAFPQRLKSPKTQERFRKEVRGLFTSGNRSLVKTYLTFLVDKIVVNDHRLEVHAKKDAAVKMLSAETEPGSLLSSPAAVLTSDLDWLRHLDSNQGPCD